MVAVIVLLLALAGIGGWGQVRGWWPWTGPTVGPTVTAGPASTTQTPDDGLRDDEPGYQDEGTDGPPQAAAGDCLTAYPVTLFYDDLRPADWASSTVECGSGDNVQIAKVVPDGQSATCDDAAGCWSFSDGGYTYLVNTVPWTGDCFYGFLNTGYPDRGNRSAYADALHTGECGTPFPPLDEAQTADTHGQPASDLVPTEFQIVALYNEGVDGTGMACPAGASPWRGITFARGVTMTVCTVVSS